MSNPGLNVFVANLLTFRAQLVAQLASVDAILKSLDLPSGSKVNVECPHPSEQLMSKQTMGHAHLFFCKQCGQNVEVKNGKKSVISEASPRSRRG